MNSLHDVNAASTYFNENWQRYQSSVKNNTLYHREMLAALDNFLSKKICPSSFSFVDIGCGDSSTVAPILANKPIIKYIGVDAAVDVLKAAATTLANLPCKKEFVPKDMLTAIQQLSSPVDIIFSSYAVHHLSLKNKIDFITQCKQKLTQDGFLLMVDGVLKKNQTRDEWLLALKERMQATIPDISPDELAIRMQHPSNDDFPESIETFSEIAQSQSWKSFQLLVDKGIFAFMVFAKS